MPISTFSIVTSISLLMFQNYLDIIIYIIVLCVKGDFFRALFDSGCLFYEFIVFYCMYSLTDISNMYITPITIFKSLMLVDFAIFENKVNNILLSFIWGWGGGGQSAALTLVMT